MEFSYQNRGHAYLEAPWPRIFASVPSAEDSRISGRYALGRNICGQQNFLRLNKLYIVAFQNASLLPKSHQVVSSMFAYRVSFCKDMVSHLKIPQPHEGRLMKFTKEVVMYVR